MTKYLVSSKKTIIFVLKVGETNKVKEEILKNKKIMKSTSTRRVINGKTYDTQTAELVGWYKRSSTLYRRVKARDYFMTFNNSCDFALMTENQAYKIMHSGEFIFD